MTVARSLICILFLTAIATDLHADDAPPYVPPDFMAQLPPLPASADATNVWKLDLPQALQIAIHQNLGVVLERESVTVASLGIDVANGTFEPVVSSTVDHASADQPPTSIQAGMPGAIITNKNEDWRLSVAEHLPTGAQVEVDFLNSRLASNGGTAVEPLYYSSTVQASVTQPLLRGFSTDLVVPRVDLLRAKIASKRERAQLAVTAADVIERTEDAYWDVVLALFTYDLQVRSQKRAEDQLALTQRQIASGLNPPSDLISAESTLAQRNLQVVQAEQQIEASSDALRTILNLPPERSADVRDSSSVGRGRTRRRAQASARARPARSRSPDRAAGGSPGREREAAADRSRADRVAVRSGLDLRRRTRRHRPNERHGL
jgi:outer membrane protein TolC